MNGRRFHIPRYSLHQRIATLALMVLLGCASIARAQSDGDDDLSVDPAVSTTAPRWVEPLLIGIGITFAAAAVVGPLIRLERPSDLPATHSHDEPPGSSGHHGPTGTFDTHAQPELPGYSPT